MYQFYEKKINLGLRVWVKCGFSFSSAATSAFYTFKIRTSTDSHFTPAFSHFTPGLQRWLI